MTFLSWGMLLSLHARNPLVLNDGDVVLRMLLFWSLFLPLGARWSFDAGCASGLDVADQRQVVSFGTFGYICQLVMIYLFAGLLKTGDSWTNGMAVRYVMEFDMYGKPLRYTLLQYPAVMEWLTSSTVALEKYGWLLLFVPFRQEFFRTVAIALFVPMHIGFFLTMTLGIFPWVCIVSWIPLIPSWLLDGVCAVIKTALSVFPVRVISILNSASVRLLPVVSSDPSIKLGILGNAMAILSLGTITISNLVSVSDMKLPDPFRTAARYLRITQRWELFAPDPPMNDGWFIVDAHLADGREFDLLTNHEMTHEKPTEPARLFRNHRERKYFRNLLKSENKELRKCYVESIGKRWNRSNTGTPLEIETIQLIYMNEPTLRDGSRGKIFPKVLWRHWFQDKFRSRFYPDGNA